MVLSSWQASAAVQPIHLINVEQLKATADLWNKQIGLCRKSLGGS